MADTDIPVTMVDFLGGLQVTQAPHKIPDNALQKALNVVYENNSVIYTRAGIAAWKRLAGFAGLSGTLADIVSSFSPVVPAEMHLLTGFDDPSDFTVLHLYFFVKENASNRFIYHVKVDFDSTFSTYTLTSTQVANAATLGPETDWFNNVVEHYGNISVILAHSRTLFLDHVTPADTTPDILSTTGYVATSGVIHKDRLFTAGKDSSILYYSEAGSLKVNEGFVNIFQSSLEIHGLVSISDVLYITTSGGLFGLFIQGEITDWVLRKISNLSCVGGPKSAVAHKSHIYFLTTEGIFISDGVSTEDISTPVFDLFRDSDLGDINSTDINQNIYYTPVEAVVLDHRILFKIPVLDDSDNIKFVYLVWDTKYTVWTQWTFNEDIMGFQEITRRARNTRREVIFKRGGLGFPKRTIYSFNEDKLQDDSYTSGSLVRTTWNSELKTKEFDFSAPHLYKWFKWGVVQMHCHDADVRIYENFSPAHEVLTEILENTHQFHFRKIESSGRFITCSFEVICISTDGMIMEKVENRFGFSGITGLLGISNRHHEGF